jgi:deoxyribodipyrimidine photolyase
MKILRIFFIINNPWLKKKIAESFDANRKTNIEASRNLFPISKMTSNESRKLYGKIDFRDVWSSYRARTSNSHKYKYLNCSMELERKTFLSRLFYFCENIVFPSFSGIFSS